MGFAPGETVGPYRVIQQLGSGGMATVFKAYHAALDRDVAIKVMHPAFRGDADFLARFRREARVVAKLDHANIISIYDFNEHEGAPYLVMRFIDGETLKSRLSHGRITLSEILDLIRPVGEALTYAHEQGILHRDIKPSNILLSRDNRVFLTDFGLARVVEAGESSLTRDALVGTPFYISPEQAMGKSELDARTDIYSLGVVLYELLTGRVPFQSDTPYAVIHDHIYTRLPLPSAVNPDLPPGVERVLLKALAKEPADRYTSALGLVQAIEEAITDKAATLPIQASTPISSVPPSLEPIPEARLPKRSGGVEAPSGKPTAAESTLPKRQANNRVRRVFGLGGLVLVVALGLAVIVMLARGKNPEVTNNRLDTADQSLSGVALVEQTIPSKELEDNLTHAAELAAQGDLDGALGKLEAATAHNLDTRSAHAEVARRFLQHGDLEAAIVVLRHGIRANTENRGLRLDLVQVLAAADRWAEAAPEIEWLIEVDPELAEPHAYKSIYLTIENRNFEGARREAEAALRLNPESPEAHFALGILHWELGQVGRARLELERAVRAPEIAPLLRQRIQALLDRLD